MNFKNLILVGRYCIDFKFFEKIVLGISSTLGCEISITAKNSKVRPLECLNLLIKWSGAKEAWL